MCDPGPGLLLPSGGERGHHDTGEDMERVGPQGDTITPPNSRYRVLYRVTPSHLHTLDTGGQQIDTLMTSHITDDSYVTSHVTSDLAF